MIHNERFSCFFYGLIYQTYQTNCLALSHLFRLRVLRASGFLDEVEKQIVDRLLLAVKHKKVTLVEDSLPLKNLLNYREYKMLCQNQPAEYICKLFNQLVETNTLSEADLTMLQQAQRSHQFNSEEEQIIKRIFYSIKRGRIKVVQTSELFSENNVVF